MFINHLGFSPDIDESTYVAPNATVCGNVKIGKNSRIMFGAAVVAEGGDIEIGDNCVILENAVLRSTVKASLKIGNNVLIGPNAHVAGSNIEDNVFIATGASILHGSRIGQGSEVRINGIVHTQTVMKENACVPIGWVAVGNPAQILPPEAHEEIWAIQKHLNFPKFVYGVERRPDGGNAMPEIMGMMTSALKNHKEDKIIK